jgi:hypothetical protein
MNYASRADIDDLSLSGAGLGGFSGHRLVGIALFAARAVMPVTAPPGALCSDKQRGWEPGVSKMSYHQRPHELRLAISSEAEALTSDFGGEAYAEACRRAEEASSDSLARDWSVVAAMLARWSGRRSSVLDALFG